MNEQDHKTLREDETMSEATVPSAAAEPGTEAASESAPDEFGLEAVRAETAEWRDKYLRKLAEFDNFRKRSRGELDQARDAALDSVLVNLLPVLDDLDRMLSGWGAGDDAHRKGVELIRAKFWAYFSARGVQRMESLGMMFDAAEHEALAMQPTADFPPHTVMAVIAPGYRRAERVLRHAQVIVSSDVTSLNEGN